MDEIEQEILIASGCKSLGNRVFEDAKRMVATSLAIAFLKNCESNHFASALAKGEVWLQKMEEIHPMLPYP